MRNVSLTGALLPAAIVMNSTGTYSLSGSGSFGGAASVTQNGSGTLLLNTANTYTGPTVVNAGTLRLGVSSALGATSAITLASGATLDLNGLTFASLNLSGTGALSNSSNSANAYVTSLTLPGNAAVSNDSSQKPILLGSITGTNGALNLGGFTLAKNGTGTLIVNGLTLSSSGNIVINAGALQLMDDYGTSGATQQQTFLSGSGTITVNSGGSLLLARSAPSLGLSMRITFNGGTLGSLSSAPNGANISSNISLASSSTFNFAGAGLGTVFFSGVISGSSTATLTVGGDSMTRTLYGVNTYTGPTIVTGGTLAVGSSGSLGSGAYAGTLSLAAGTGFKYASTRAQALSGQISGAGTLNEAGPGTLTLAATDPYSGATTVTGGTLLVSGSLTGSATLVTAGTLGGTGSLGALSVAAGGIVQPGIGATPGLLSSGDFTLAAGGHFTLELGGTAGTGNSATSYGEMSVGGAVSLARDVRIAFVNGYTPAVGDTFYAILNDGSDAVTGGFSNAPGGLLTYSGVQYQVSYTANGGDGGANDVALTVAAVPEPGAGVLAGAGAALVAGFRRRRRARRPAQY